jgi:hypothetical protein
MPDRTGRHYRLTDFPTLRGGLGLSADHRDLLLKLYGSALFAWMAAIWISFSH